MDCMAQLYSHYICLFRVCFFVVLVCFGIQNVNAQLDVSTGYTGSQLANALAGPGVIVSNISYSGDPVAAGLFDGTSSNIGIDSGVLFTTGHVIAAVGPNSAPGAGFNNTGPTYTPVANTFDACILEFDVVPVFDTLKFNYVFGSEEYPEYVNQFNDGFGLFLSGPGIAGNQNIAMLPGGIIPVTINTVNSGMNSIYYNDNTGGTSVQYDAFTTKLTAKANVQPCQTYHLQFVIFDSRDPFFDSGVFVEYGSITSGQESLSINDVATCAGQSVTLIANTVVGGGTYLWNTGETTESIVVTHNVNTQYALDYFFGTCNALYTATVNVFVTPGVNVSISPDTVAICPGQSAMLTGNISATGINPKNFSNSVPVVIADASSTGSTFQTTSNINVTGMNASSLGPNTLSSVCIDIVHSRVSDLAVYLQAPNGSFIPLSLNNGGSGMNYLSTCFDDIGQAISSGVAPFSGNWTPEQPLDSLTGPVNGNWSLQIFDQVNGIVGQIQSWNITFNDYVSITGFSWMPTTGLTNANTLTPIAGPLVNTTYRLGVENSLGCVDTAEVSVEIGGLEMTLSSTNVTCGDTNGTATVNLLNGTAPINYAWSNGANTAAITNLPTGNYAVMVTDAVGCFASGSVNIVPAGVPSGPPGIWTWLGTYSQIWFEPCNWDKLTVPDSTSNVLIPGGTPYACWVGFDTAYCRTRTIDYSNGGHLYIHRNSGGKMIVKP